MVNNLIENIGKIIDTNLWFAPLLVFFAGLLTSFTPCCLANISLIVSYVGGTSNNTKKAFLLSLTFALGSATTFAVLGVVASLIGKAIEFHSSLWEIILGSLMLLMALQIFEIYSFIPSSNLISKNTKRGFLGAFLAGMLGGFFSSPCATPVLVVILALVAEKGNIVFGILLLLLYSIGHSVLTILAGTSVGFVKKLTTDDRYHAYSKLLKNLMGFVILIFGLYLFYLGFFHVHE